MPRFFVSKAAVIEDDGQTKITIVGEDAFHITRSLRMRPGEKLTLCDDTGIEYTTEIYDIPDAENVVVRVLSLAKSCNEPPYRCTVYQALVKGDRFDIVLQKSTELGAAVIVPVITSRCMVKIDSGDVKRKTERWQKIAAEAAKQCGRAVIPTVCEPMMFKAAAAEASKTDLPLFCYEGEGTSPISKYLDNTLKPETAAIMIGPEGGYAPEEADLAAKNGMLMTGLGKRILRTETASLYVLSCLSLKYEL